MDSILEMYLYETDALLEQLDSIALAAEQVNTFTQGNVDEIFRVMHTIKGSSAMMEFTPLMTIAHRIEDMFFIIRENGMKILSEERRGELFDLTFQATDYFRNEVRKSLKASQPLPEDIDSFLSKINTLITKIQSDMNKDTLFPPPQRTLPLPHPLLRQRLRRVPFSCPLRLPLPIRVQFDEEAVWKACALHPNQLHSGHLCGYRLHLYTR